MTVRNVTSVGTTGPQATRGKSPDLASRLQGLFSALQRQTAIQAAPQAAVV